MNERLEGFLRAKQARYDVVPQAGVVTAQEQAAASRTPGRWMAKVLIVKERDGYVMAVLPASTVLDPNRLKGLIGHGEIRLATVEEIASVVPDCAPGAIPPFGSLFGLRSFVDRALLEAPSVTMPGGDLATSIRMTGSEFARLVDARPGTFAVPLAVAGPRRRTSGPLVRRRMTGRRGAR